MDPMNQPGGQLDDRARDVLARYKAEIGPSPQDVSASWQAIAAQASVEGEVAVAAQQRRSVARRGFALGVLVATVTTAAAAVLVLWLQPWDSTATSEPDGHQAAQYEGRERTEGGNAVPREPEPTTTRRDARTRDDAVLEPIEADLVIEEDDLDEGLDEGLDEDLDEGLEASRPKRAEPRPTVDPITALKEETALLDRARGALSAGRARDALARVAEHGRRFPRGAMAEEAAAIAVGALCEVGPAKRWRNALAGFDRRYPKSPLRVHLRDDCFSQ